MDLTIHPQILQGTISVIPSKSQAHRYLIAAAFADGPTDVICRETNRDMDATMECLNALGAVISKDSKGYHVIPLKNPPENTDLPCHDSGSTLRFLLPVAGALGVNARFLLEGRLPQRPLSPLWEEMEKMGCRLSRPTENTILCQGKLQPGTYTIDGGVSSQFITGLLYAAALIPGDCLVNITGRIESRPYIEMTQKALSLFSLHSDNLKITGEKVLHSPGTLTVEGDWSNGAFFLAANALANHLNIQNLQEDSCQGDRAVSDLLSALQGCPTISVADIPDLTPILAVTAACKKGAVFTDIRRLRLKESDRVESILQMVKALGGSGEATENTLTIHGGGLTGGTVDAKNDHRIAMAAAIAATVCKNDVTILGAECVNKSYPGFFKEYARLGGTYEQYIR